MFRFCFIGVGLLSYVSAFRNVQNWQNSRQTLRRILRTGQFQIEPVNDRGFQIAIPSTVEHLHRGGGVNYTTYGDLDLSAHQQAANVPTLETILNETPDVHHKHAANVHNQDTTLGGPTDVHHLHGRARATSTTSDHQDNVRLAVAHPNSYSELNYHPQYTKTNQEVEKRLHTPPRLRTIDIRVEKFFPSVTPKHAKRAWLEHVWKEGGGVPTMIYFASNPKGKLTYTTRMHFPSMMHEELQVNDEVSDAEQSAKTMVEYRMSNSGLFKFWDAVTDSHRGRVQFTALPTDPKNKPGNVGTTMLWTTTFEDVERFNLWHQMSKSSMCIASDNLEKYLAKPEVALHTQQQDWVSNSGQSPSSVDTPSNPLSRLLGLVRSPARTYTLDVAASPGKKIGIFLKDLAHNLVRALSVKAVEIANGISSESSESNQQVLDPSHGQQSFMEIAADLMKQFKKDMKTIYKGICGLLDGTMGVAPDGNLMIGTNFETKDYKKRKPQS